MKELEKLQLELKPLEELKTEIESRSAKRTTAVVWGGLAYMALQFGLLARLTWWEYSWDIMEPVTYFVGYGTAMAAYAYFILTRQVSRDQSAYTTGIIWSTNSSLLLNVLDFLLLPLRVSHVVLRTPNSACVDGRRQNKFNSF